MQHEKRTSVRASACVGHGGKTENGSNRRRALLAGRCVNVKGISEIDGSGRAEAVAAERRGVIDQRAAFSFDTGVDNLT